MYNGIVSSGTISNLTLTPPPAVSFVPVPTCANTNVTGQIQEILKNGNLLVKIPEGNSGGGEQHKRHRSEPGDKKMAIYC
jgi:hypothetical protein